MTLEESAARLSLPEVYTKPQEVDDIYTRLRQSGRIVRAKPEAMRPYWAVTKATDIQFIETNPDKFLAEPWPGMMVTAQEERNLELFGRISGATTTLVSMDGETHHKHRLLAQAWFSPKNIKTLSPFVTELAERFITKMESMNGKCDFVQDVAYWYPLRVVNSILGVPESVDPTFLRLTRELFGAIDPRSGFPVEEALASMQRTNNEFLEIFEPIITNRRQNPTNDLASTYANAKIDGEPLGLAETLGLFLITATAGHDTTSSTAAGGLKALIENSQELKKLRENPDLLPNAIEEFLRWVAPVKHFGRTATVDIKIGDQLIREGEQVVPFFASACRDEDIFENPFEFRIDRKPNNHLAFGVGPHVCIGMYLARLELRIFFEKLLPRLKEIKIAGEPTYLPANLVSGLTSLPIEFEFHSN